MSTNDRRNCKQAVARSIRSHWTVPTKIRTPEQDEAEEYLITFYLGKNRYLHVTNIKFSRWYLFFASFLVQFCIGSIYSWSVLNQPIDTLIYNDKNAEKAVNAFYTAIGTLGLTSSIMGPWIERHGPRAGVCLGTSSFLAGKIICAIAVHYKSMTGVIVGYGIFCGFGVGLCYISPVSALQKWFPDRRGTAAGFAVGGYGAGSIVWAKVYLPVMNSVGLSSMFLVVGFIMGTTMYLCAIVLRSPHPNYIVGGLNIHGESVEAIKQQADETARHSFRSPCAYESMTTPTDPKFTTELHNSEPAAAQVRKLTLIQAITSIDFVFLYIGFFANLLFGLIVLSRLSSMCVNLFGKTANQAATIVSINGVFNCCGRLGLPAVSDLLIRVFKLESAFGRKCMYIYTLGTQVIIIGTLPTVIDNKNYTLFVAEVFLLTLSYGGGVGTIPCFLTDMFGAYNIGAIHGLILSAWSIGGVVGGITFNHAYLNAIKTGKTMAEAYRDNIHKIFIVVVIGFCFVLLVRTNAKDRFSGGYRFSVFGFTLIDIKRTVQSSTSTRDNNLNEA